MRDSAGSSIAPLVTRLEGHPWEHGFQLGASPTGKQNDPTRQTVAPYSLRGMPWPTVAAPLTWHEVEEAAQRRAPELLTVVGDAVFDRLDRHGDLFDGVLELEQALPV